MMGKETTRQAENTGPKCSCGFRFSGAGEFRTCPAFVTKDGRSGVVCPECDRNYVDGVEIVFETEREV